VSELVFPLLGVAFVFLVLLPMCAAGVKLLLVLLERNGMAGPLRGLGLRFVLLSASSILPLVWLFSAGMHQAESGRSVLACLFTHDARTLCLESALFALALGAIAVARCHALAGRLFRGSTGDGAPGALEARLDRVLALYPALAPLRRRVVAIDDPTFCIGTRGWLRPHVVVGSDFGSKLTDDMLASALGHEAAHVRALDPLCYFAVELALALNPFGRVLLDGHARRWYAAREMQCDREAVDGGCPPVALADAILRAARPQERGAAALGAPDLAVLRLRIQLLLALAEQRPERRGHPRGSSLPVAAALLLLAVLSPHQLGTGALDALHRGAEHAAAYLIRLQA